MKNKAMLLVIILFFAFITGCGEPPRAQIQDSTIYCNIDQELAKQISDYYANNSAANLPLEWIRGIILKKSVITTTSVRILLLVQTEFDGQIILDAYWSNAERINMICSVGADIYFPKNNNGNIYIDKMKLNKEQAICIK